ncbi:unnamed protein product [Peniophora sp. CBMAI 1063]|nr:unnamed protein product [Peniophora sp. CBMAI 1063]
MKFFAGLVTLAFALAVSASATPFKRDAATVERDIAAISAQVGTLNAAITRFGNSKSATDADAIHRDSQELEGRINKATADTRNSKDFNEDEGRTILREFQALAPEIVATLQNLDNQHHNLAAERGRDAVVESDLKTLNGDTVAFENALLDKEPADDRAAVRAADDRINAAFAEAIRTFAS